MKKEIYHNIDIINCIEHFRYHDIHFYMQVDNDITRMQNLYLSLSYIWLLHS